MSCIFYPSYKILTNLTKPPEQLFYLYPNLKNYHPELHLSQNKIQCYQSYKPCFNLGMSQRDSVGCRDVASNLWLYPPDSRIPSCLLCSSSLTYDTSSNHSIEAFEQMEYRQTFIMRNRTLYNNKKTSATRSYSCNLKSKQHKMANLNYFEIWRQAEAEGHHYPALQSVYKKYKYYFSFIIIHYNAVIKFKIFKLTFYYRVNAVLEYIRTQHISFCHMFCTRTI